MAHSPMWEDYQRMAYRFVASLPNMSVNDAARSLEDFAQRFAHERDSLPQTDEERAFHLVAVVADMVDQELPIADDERAQQIMLDAPRMLDEALSLDKGCQDAVRMSQTMSQDSFESTLTFLMDRRAEVRERCEEDFRKASEHPSLEIRLLGRDLALRPYLRWVSQAATYALVLGHNRQTLTLVDEALKADPGDAVGALFTGVLAYAKLEDEEGLEAFVKSSRRHGALRADDNPWTLMARMAIAYKQRDFTRAASMIDILARNYHHALDALYRRIDLPEGVFARIAVQPYSEDEVTLCIAESLVFLQEGVDAFVTGTMGSWVVEEVSKRLPNRRVQALKREMASRQAESEGMR